MIVRNHAAALAAFAILPSAMLAASFIAPPVSVGENLQVETRIGLSDKAPAGGLAVRVASADPSRMLLSLQAEEAGAAAITVKIAEGQRSSPEFLVHGLGNKGMVDFKLEAPGIEPGAGQATLTPSGIVVKGPANPGVAIRTTPHAWAPKIFVLAVQYDASGEILGTQKVRGGFTAKARLTSTNSAVVGVAVPEIAIAGGEISVTTELRPAGIGDAEILASAVGFQVQSAFQRLPINIYEPSIGLLDEMHLGNRLQITAALTLGEPAPAGGLAVTLVSKDPSRLLLASNSHDKGKASIVITVPAGANSAPYTVQGMAEEGTATYTASAPGFRGKEATLPLVPSGVIITGPTGLPDEIEVLRPEMPLSPNGFITSLANGKAVPVTLYTVRLDPKTHRGADLTVQTLRADLALTVKLRNEHPEIGELSQTITIKGGEGQATGQFIPRTTGVADLTYETPDGYTRPTNAVVLKAHVDQ